MTTAIGTHLSCDLGHRAAYGVGVLYRDLSEGNVLITSSKEVGLRVMIIEFDYAKLLEDPTLANEPMSVRQPCFA